MLCLAYPLDVFISFLLKNTHANPGEFEVWNDIYDSNIDCDLAIYGSSRAWVHIDPKIINDSLNYNAYNFGVDGHNFWVQYLRHKEYLKHNKAPKIIVLAVDVFSLDKRPDLYEKSQFLPYMLWNKTIFEGTKSYHGFNRLDFYIPLIRYFGDRNSFSDIMNNNLFSALSPNYRENGFRAMDQEWNEDFRIAKSKMNTYQAKIDPASKRLFEKFIYECKTRGIQLILIYTPEFIEGQKFISNRSEIVDLFTEYSKTHKLVFLDYSTDSICLDKNNFYNSMHLNSRGSKEFSKKLAHDLKVIGL